jgi:hypothetical protein
MNSEGTPLSRYLRTYASAAAKNVSPCRIEEHAAGKVLFVKSQEHVSGTRGIGIFMLLRTQERVLCKQEQRFPNDRSHCIIHFAYTLASHTFCIQGVLCEQEQ